MLFDQCTVVVAHSCLAPTTSFLRLFIESTLAMVKNVAEGRLFIFE